MKDLAIIDLDDGAPERVRAILTALPGIRVRKGARSALRVDGTIRPLLILQGLAPYAHATSKALAQITSPDRTAIVVAERLAPHVRRELEEVGCSYADGAGAVHLEAPGLLIHIEPKRGQKEGALPPPRGLGAVAVRLVQVLLAERDREWSVVDLAQRAGASTGQAHNVLQRLEQEGLVTTDGRGRDRRRRIRNSTDLLDWLITVPAARRLHRRFNAFLYAPDPDALVTQLAFNAHETAIPWALTGAAAARVIGVGAVAALPVAMVRVAAKPSLADVAQQLKLEPAPNGNNLVLVADVGELGIHGAMRNGPMEVAPAVRVYVDMLGERRGEDAAALFREAALGY